VTIILIYPWPRFPFIILGIVKKKAAIVINITSISGPAFLLNIHRKGNTIFTISLYKINKILKSYKEDKEDISQL
jgi:hypothetical protein